MFGVVEREGRVMAVTVGEDGSLDMPTIVESAGTCCPAPPSTPTKLEVRQTSASAGTSIGDPA